MGESRQIAKLLTGVPQKIGSRLNFRIVIKEKGWKKRNGLFCFNYHLLYKYPPALQRLLLAYIFTQKIETLIKRIESDKTDFLLFLPILLLKIFIIFSKKFSKAFLTILLLTCTILKNKMPQLLSAKSVLISLISVSILLVSKR